MTQRISRISALAILPTLHTFTLPLQDALAIGNDRRGGWFALDGEYGSGRVGTEWDFDVTPPHELPNRLVPDIAYLSYERIGYEDDDAAQIPSVAPDAAVEILSPGQTMREFGEKVRIFLAAGSSVVIVIDPRARYAVLHDTSGTRRIEEREHIIHPALPGFDVRFASLFEKSKPRSP